MSVTGLRQTEQLLQQSMDAGRPEQVQTTHHLRHTLPSVIDYDRKMIAGRRFLAREDDIAPGLRSSDDRTFLTVRAITLFDPVERAGARACLGHVKPQCIGCA